MGKLGISSCRIHASCREYNAFSMVNYTIVLEIS
jgi:hypothetical protein